MTHSFLHFAIGYISGSIAMLVSFILKPPDRQSFWPRMNVMAKINIKQLRSILLGTNCRPSTRALAWLLASAALGAWGLVPKLIYRLTGFHSNSLWTNIFCGYGLLNRLRPGGGMVIGGLIILLATTAQYFVIVWLIKKQAD